jgi:hypothetical protein
VVVDCDDLSEVSLGVDEVTTKAGCLLYFLTGLSEGWGGHDFHFICYRLVVHFC